MRSARILILILIATFSLALWGCSKASSTVAALEAMKAGDLAKAEGLLDQALAKSPGQKDVLAARFVLFHHLSVHAAPEKQQAYLTKTIGEYDVLAAALGLKPDYADMEASLRSKPEGLVLIKAARKPIYGE
jgi:hypothetical protein